MRLIELISLGYLGLKVFGVEYLGFEGLTLIEFSSPGYFRLQGFGVEYLGFEVDLTHFSRALRVLELWGTIFSI